MFINDVEKIKNKYICFECVGEPYLSGKIEKDGIVAKCAYCGKSVKSYLVDDFATCIEDAFNDHFYRTSDSPNSWQQSMLGDRESYYDWNRDGVPVCEAIEAAALVEGNVSTDIQAVLGDRHGDFHADSAGEETEFSHDSYYAERGPVDRKWQEEWRIFESSIRKEARFFSHVAATHLASIFTDIDKVSTIFGNPIVQTVGPEGALNYLFRARVFQSETKLVSGLRRPDRDLGSPPANLSSAGRMNARGISVFYGATEERAAIAEVRPPVGSWVVVAKFNIIRPLRLLDLTAFDSVQESGSIFDPSFKDRLEKAAFLRSLELRMTKPVMPDDEAFDYLATQAIADFLATANAPVLDGIIFRSVQAKDGRNVVLFHKAARVQEMEVPEGTEIDARSGYCTEDGWEVDYCVTEMVPPSQVILDSDAFHAAKQYFDDVENTDFRDASLAIDVNSVVVHQIKWVEYDSMPSRVARHRWEKRERKF